MKKWEYKTIIWHNRTAIENINKLGKEGWELVAVSNLIGGFAYFKRELK